MFYISTKTLLVVGISSIFCQFVSALAMYHIHNINKLYCLILTLALLCLYPYCYLASQQHNLCLHLLCDSLQGSPLFFPSFASRRNLGTMFSARRLVYFPQHQHLIFEHHHCQSEFDPVSLPLILYCLSHILYCGF